MKGGRRKWRGVGGGKSEGERRREGKWCCGCVRVDELGVEGGGVFLCVLERKVMRPRPSHFCFRRGEERRGEGRGGTERRLFWSMMFVLLEMEGTV